MALFSSKRIYLDYASTTPVCAEAISAMGEAEQAFGNPGSMHQDGLRARRVLDSARERIAGILACKPRRVVFTSGLTESNNLAILGAARKLDIAGRFRGTHWVTSSIEHSSVLECFAEVERLGGEVSHVEPDEGGVVRPEALGRALKKHTAFVSIGWGNNEIGTIQPLRDIARLIRGHEKKEGTRILFHSDAGQSPLYLAPHVHTLGVDMLSLGSGKLYGPHTIGALFINDASAIAPVVFGGGQEMGLRSGTEKPVSAVGFASALETVTAEREKEGRRLRALRDELAQELVARIPNLIVNGSTSLTASGLKHVLPHMLNISVLGKKTGEYLALQLDRAGISVSTKSACDEGNQFSHVVLALGDVRSATSGGLSAEASAKAGVLTKEERATNTLRFSLGRGTKPSDIKRAIQALDKIVK